MDVQDETKGFKDEFLAQKIGEGLQPIGERRLLSCQRGMATSLHAASPVTFLQGWRHQSWSSRSSGALHLPHALLCSVIPSTPGLSGVPGGH